jgi:nitroreductase
VVLTDGPRASQAKALLGSAFRAGWEVKSRNDGYTEGSAQDLSSPKARMAATMQHYVDHIEQVPAIVLVCLVRYRDPNPFEGASVYPACQNLLVAARALGYGGALTMWHQGVEGELRALLDIPEGVALSACITLGVPAGRHGPVRRRRLDEVVFADRWGASAHWAVDDHAGS